MSIKSVPCHNEVVLRVKTVLMICRWYSLKYIPEKL